MTEAYARYTLIVAIAKILKESGFDSSSKSCLDILTDVVVNRLSKIGAESANSANIACRTEVTYHDISKALRPLRMKATQLHKHARESAELPFPYILPKIPLPQHTKMINPKVNFDDDVKVKKALLHEQRKLLRDSIPDYVPDFLPKFPDKHTYSSTPFYVEGEKDTNKLHKAKTLQNRMVESSLIYLHRAAALGVKAREEQQTQGKTPGPEVVEAVLQKAEESKSKQDDLDIDLIHLNRDYQQPANALFGGVKDNSHWGTLHSSSIGSKTLSAPLASKKRKRPLDSEPII